ncbi:hypothetical protein CCYA_CCYA06G1958 [Cyanidiococcus yangmingshanensis]|nr:hypothetical protein CCYA_CCYA06G1958 [Cyanidiococcus yangmingshanensis]
MEKREYELSLWQSVVAASTGALVTALVLNPIDVIKVTMQAQDSGMGNGRERELVKGRQACPKCRLYPSSWATMANEPRPGGTSPLTAASTAQIRQNSYNLTEILRKMQVNSPSVENCSHDWTVRGPEHCSTRLDWTRPSVLGTVRAVVRDYGIIGLWRGLSASILTIVPATGLYFGLYEQSTQYIVRHCAGGSLFADPVFVAPITGAVMRCVVATAVSPLEMARTSMQANGGSMWQTLRRTVQVGGGTRALWSGLAATLWRDAPFSAIYWGVYESLKVARSLMIHDRDSDDICSAGGLRQTQRWDQSPAIRSSFHFASGVIAGVTAAVITNPADVVKTRNQSWPGALPAATPDKDVHPNRSKSGSAGPPTQRFWPALSQLLRQEGFAGLFRGVVPRVVKVIPASGIMMVTFEEMKRWFAHNPISMNNPVDAALESSSMPQTRG